MKLTTVLTNERRTRVEARCQTNLMAWLTTVNSSGKPNTVPVWFFVTHNDQILIYSQPGKAKLRNIDENPNVALGLDVTDLGRDIIRFEGTAVRASDHPPADQVPGYAAKYAERIAAIFGTVEQFAATFTEPILISLTRLHA